jgi:cleavage stimulation factor subunit 3
MSEPPTFDPIAEDLSETNSFDKTLPAEEIQNDLEQITRTAPNSQELIQQQQQQDVPTVPRSEWETIRDQLREKPHDPSAWNKLVLLAESSGDIEKIKESYEELLEVYPNTVCCFSCGCKISRPLTVCIASHRHKSRT